MIFHYYWYRDQAGTKEGSGNTALHYFRNRDPGAFVSLSGGGVLASADKPAEAQQFLASSPAPRASGSWWSPGRWSTRSATGSPPIPALPPLQSLEAPPVDPFTLDSEKVIQMMTDARASSEILPANGGTGSPRGRAERADRAPSRASGRAPAVVVVAAGAIALLVIAPVRWSSSQAAPRWAGGSGPAAVPPADRGAARQHRAAARLTVPATVVIGIGAAWLVERSDLPGAAVWRTALLAPLAVPAFVSSYAWSSVLPSVQGLGGAVFVTTAGVLPVRLPARGRAAARPRPG